MTDPQPSPADIVFANMKSRRVVRSYADEPVADDLLWKIAQAGRWATSGGNMHPHKFLITRDPAKVRLIRSFSPGMLTNPPAIVVIMTDRQAALRERLQIDIDHVRWIDTGTAAMNMMNMAHALGIGACPVTSFSQSGVGRVLDLPEHLIPELLLMLGHPKPVDRGLTSAAPKPVTTRDLTFWERVGVHEPEEA